ncbi:MAG: hypothetical protein ABUS56_01765, partial [Acidobacteriota bacterium]
MKGLASLTPVVLAAVAAGLLPGATGAQSASALAGIWTLNRSLSEFPPELGFNMAWAAVPDGTGQSPGAQTGGAGGRRASAGGRNPSAAAPFARPESYDDARRRQLLTAEARNPPARQIIVDTPGAVTVTNELGQSRVFHPTGKEESIEIQGVTIGVTSTRETDRFVVVYHVGQSRDIRYTYAYASTPSQLIVDVQLLERGAGDKARRIYEPGMLVEPRPASGSSATGAAPPRPLPPTPAGPGPSRPEALDQRPGAELR